MPLHTIRKRYVLFKWSKDDATPNIHELHRLLDNFNGDVQSEAERSLTRLIVLDSQACMGIIKTRHTLVSKLKTQLTTVKDGYSLPKFQVVLVSGTIKKLKVRLHSANLN